MTQTQVVQRSLLRLSEFVEKGESHSNASLWSHLINTASILQAWQCSDSTIVAGMFHAVYGTATFVRNTPPSREALVSAIGADAEKLVYVYSRRDVIAFHNLLGRVAADQGKKVESSYGVELCRNGHREVVTLSAADCIAVLRIASANAIEQCRGDDTSLAKTSARLAGFWELLTPAAQTYLAGTGNRWNFCTAARHVLDRGLLVLSLREQAAVVDPLYQQWQIACLDSLAQHCIALQRLETSGSTLNEYTELPRTSKLRIATAPETVARLRGGPSARSRAFLNEAVRAETTSLKVRGESSGPAIWTALGDAAFSPQGVWRSPCIGGVLPVDAFSPRCHPSGTHATGLQATPTPVALDTCVQQIELATQVLALVPDAWRMVYRWTRVIILLQTADPRAGFGSSSWSRYIGKTALSNAIVSAPTSPRLASALLHEAVHAMLYVVELAWPFTTGGAKSRTVLSPWSGRVLPLASYLHACLVWYCLWAFWKRARRCVDDAGELARAHRGFHTCDITLPLVPMADVIRPELIPMFRRMQETVRAGSLADVNESDGVRASQP